MHVLADQTRAFSFPPKLFPVLRDPGGGADVSLSEPVGQGGRVPRSTTSRFTNRSLTSLPRRCTSWTGRPERAVVRLRFGLGDDRPRTLQQIGERLHVSRERVRQIECRAK